MNLVRRLFAILILFLLPFCGLLWTIDQIQQQKQQQERTEVIETQKRILASLTRQASIGYFFREASERIVRALKWDQDPSELISNLPKQTTTLFLFTAQGKRRSGQGFAGDLIAASERCLALILTTARTGETSFTARDRKLASSLLGNENAIILLAQRLGHLVSLEGLGEERSAGCFPFRSVSGRSGYVLMLVNHRHNLDTTLLERSRQRLESLTGKTYTFGWFDLTRLESPATPLPLPGSSTFYSERSTGSRLSDDGSESWCWRVLQRRHLVYSHTRLPPPLQPLAQRHPLLIAMLLAALGILLFLLHRLEERGVSIRLQIIFLFGLSSLASIAALAGFAVLYLEHRRETLLRDHELTVAETLNQWDSTFQKFCAIRDQNYTQAALQMSQHLSSRERLDAISSQLPGVGTKVSLFLLDHEGRELYRRNSAANMNLHDFLGESYLQVLRLTVKLSCDIERHQRLSKRISNLPEPKTDNAFIDALTRDFRGRRGKTRTLSVGAKAQVIYTHFLYDAQELPIGIVFMIHQNRYLEHEYLRSMLKNPPPWCQAPFPIKVFSVSENGAMHSMISRNLGSAVIDELSDSVTQTQAPQHRFISIPGDSERYLLTAIPSRYLSALRLYMISSLEQIEQRSRRLVQAFTLFGVCITLLGLSLSLVFSNLLLHPMARIGEGLQQLAAGKFSHRINVCTGDEMEELSSGLNKTLEEMQELAVAKNIQEHLLPAAPLQTPSGSCQGWIRSQSEIGNEIYDFQSLSQGRIGFWLAGVPGHTISSALILAMMKMAGRLFLSFGESSPEHILDQFVRFIRDKVQTNGDIYLCIGIYDPQQQQTRLSMQGSFFTACVSRPMNHPAAVRLTSEGAPSSSERRTLTVPLDRDERLLLLSPGFLARTTFHHFEMFLQSQIREHGAGSLQQLGDSLLANTTEELSDAEPTTRSLVALEVSGT